MRYFCVKQFNYTQMSLINRRYNLKLAGDNAFISSSSINFNQYFKFLDYIFFLIFNAC
jgi:hypothetical protein